MTRETPDIDTSSDAYARRFSGPVGRFFLDVQSRATLELLQPWLPCSVLDVGGGHAQLAAPLAHAGCGVTVLGSSTECARRLEPLLRDRRAAFVTGDIQAAPFGDQSFDVVLAFRLLPHVARWEALLVELGRLARRAVVVDYPTRRSVNAVADAFFGLKRGVERDTRPFRVFGEREIAGAASAAGLGETARRPQFFAPMALHRALRAVTVSRALESTARLVGLTRWLGSPVVLRLEKNG